MTYIKKKSNKIWNKIKNIILHNSDEELNKRNEIISKKYLDYRSQSSRNSKDGSHHSNHSCHSCHSCHSNKE
jgi:hypothetical protein